MQIIVYNILRHILENGFKKQKQFIRDRLLTQFLPGGKILDLGCGTGTYTDIFDRDSYVGLEINPLYIKCARQDKGADFVLADACHLPFKSGVFTAVCSIAVFHHLPEPEVFKILKEARRVMAPCGLFLLMDQADIGVHFLVNWFFRLIRYFDQGRFIRTPRGNLDILTQEPDFNIISSWAFRSGLITYQGMLLKRNE